MAYDDEIEYEDEMAYDDEYEPSSRLQSLALRVAAHPRALFGSLSSLLGISADIAYHEPLWALFGIGIAAVLGLTSDQARIFRHIALGSDHDPSDTIADLSDSILGEPPEDQSLRAKIARLFNRGEEETTLPKKGVKKLSGNVEGVKKPQELTEDLVITMFMNGTIDDVQLIRLLEHLQGRTSTRTERNRDSDAHADIVEYEAASEANGATQMEPSRPAGWNEEKEQQLIGAYLINGNYCKCLERLGFSDTQRNRDYAREILKKHGFLKGK